MAYRPLAIGGQLEDLGAPEDIMAQSIKAGAARDLRKKAVQDAQKAELDLAKQAVENQEYQRGVKEDASRRGVLGDFIRNREGAMDLPIGVQSPEFGEAERPSNAPFGPMNAPPPKPNRMERRTTLDLAAINPDLAETFRKGQLGERQGLEDRTRKINAENQAEIRAGAEFALKKKKNETDAEFNDRQQKEIERQNRAKNNLDWFNAQTDRQKVAATTPEIPTTKGEQAYDRYAAKDLAEWDLGGSTEVDKNLKQLETAVEGIYPIDKRTGKRKAVDGISGKVVGRLPDWARSNESINARDQITEVAQRNLRQVLGAQYTEKEGVALIRRAYNETLPVEVNVQRLNNLIRQIKHAKEAKDAASQYFKQYGTLKGFNTKLLKTGAGDFNPEVPTFDSDAEADAAGLEPGTKVIVGGREGVWEP